MDQNSMFLKYLFLFLLIFISCKSQDVTGDYTHIFNKIGPDRLELVLRKDSSFVYETWSDIIGKQIVKGKWYSIQDTLFLEPDTLPHKPLFKMKEGETLKISGIKVTVLNITDDSPLLGTEVYFNDDPQPHVVDTLGQVYINKEEEIRKIIVKYISEESLNIEDLNTNNILIYFDPNNFKIDPVYVNSEWIIKKNRLVPLDDEGKQLIDSEFVKK